MIPPSSASAPRPPRTRACRRVLVAPQIERYLARANVDFSALDQTDALRVRVMQGIAVYRERLAAAKGCARRQIRDTSLVALGAALAAAFYFPAARRGALAERVTEILLLGLVLTALVRLAQSLLDFRGLGKLARDPRQRVVEAATMDELAASGEEVLAEARAVGAVPANDAGATR